MPNSPDKNQPSAKSKFSASVQIIQQLAANRLQTALKSKPAPGKRLTTGSIEIIFLLSVSVSSLMWFCFANPKQAYSWKSISGFGVEGWFLTAILSSLRNYFFFFSQVCSYPAIFAAIFYIYDILISFCSNFIHVCNLNFFGLNFIHDKGCPLQ